MLPPTSFPISSVRRAVHLSVPNALQLAKVQTKVAVSSASCQVRGVHSGTSKGCSPANPPITEKRSFSSINTDTPYSLCFVRHGQSTWNRDNRFIGWTDTPLTDDGVLEARVAGQMLAKSGMLFDEVHTSYLRRSIRTTNVILMEMGQEYLPVHKHWRLNERSYGDLVGKNKKETVIEFGKDQVKRWRRSYDEPPPPMNRNHENHPRFDPRYRLVSWLLLFVHGHVLCHTIIDSIYFPQLCFLDVGSNSIG